MDGLGIPIILEGEEDVNTLLTIHGPTNRSEITTY